ncbi:uncharacterized protein LOC143277775 [Babylonia areolata]|uniref:uncharacterized protein LOC143277775 n=1 Tax=Babylonia areolata TaxID=304850 RepID=UPI003FD1BD6E
MCKSEASCKSGICKIVLGGDCSKNKSQCASGLCSENSCRIPSGKPCTSSTSELCQAGAFCNANNFCKLALGQKCAKDTECQSGTMCSARASVKKCRLPLGSSGCGDDDACVANTVCDHENICRISKGGNCQSHPDMCLHGALCSGGKCQCNSAVADTQTEKCDAKDNKVGGGCTLLPVKETGDGSHLIEIPKSTCNDPRASCIDNKCQCQSSSLVAEPTTLECRGQPGAECDTNTGRCVPGAVCDTDLLCAIDVGHSCSGERSGNCRIGSVCDTDEKCHLDINQNCANTTNGCRNGTVCDVLNRCKRTYEGTCSTDENCVAGSHCSKDGVCDCTEGVSAQVGSSCGPVDGAVGGKCGGDDCKDSNAVCNEDSGKCECKEGYAGTPLTLACAKAVDQECTDDEECVTGTTCDPATSKCRTDLGQMCGGDKDCVTGAVCDFDSVCKLDLKGNCSGPNRISCRSGTFCDFLDQCNHGVGDVCNGSLTDQCVAGATCEESRCTCDLEISHVYGASCEPKKGMPKGNCDLACDVDHSVCVDGICQCDESFKPDRQFKCVGHKSEDGTSKESFIIPILVAALLALLATVVFLLLRRRRNRARADIKEKGSASLKHIQKLGEDVSAMIEANAAYTAATSTVPGSGEASSTPVAQNDAPEEELSSAESEAESDSA